MDPERDSGLLDLPSATEIDAAVETVEILMAGGADQSASVAVALAAFVIARNDSFTPRRMDDTMGDTPELIARTEIEYCDQP